MTEHVALSMIVRDAQAFLPACLASVRGAVEEMVIADTGSQDATIAIARDAGAQVISIPWTNDFAAARNAALAPIRAPWVLSLDADEQLDPHAIEAIPTLLSRTPCAGYQVTIRNYVHSLADRLWDQPAKRNDSGLPAAQNFPAYVEHQNVRLFRRSPKISFIGRVHESVGPAIERAGETIGNANFVIHHFGLALDQEAQARKNIFYRDLGYQKIQDSPFNAQAHFELGILELDNFHDFPAAQSLFARARTLDPRFGLACFFEALSFAKLEQYTHALPCLDEAERRGYKSALVAETRGDALYNLGDFSAARSAYSAARRRDPLSAALQSKLGLATMRAGDRPRGLRELRAAVSAAGAAPEIHDRLILALVWAGQLRDAAAAADGKLAAIALPQASDFMRAASLWAKSNHWQTAARIVHHGLQQYPNHSGLLHAAQEIAANSAIPTLVTAPK
jgi:glycosyltransferase involved in cell wall biosynthesis